MYKYTSLGTVINTYTYYRSLLGFFYLHASSLSLVTNGDDITIYVCVRKCVQNQINYCVCTDYQQLTSICPDWFWSLFALKCLPPESAFYSKKTSESLTQFTISSLWTLSITVNNTGGTAQFWASNIIIVKHYQVLSNNEFIIIILSSFSIMFQFQ